MVLHLLQQGVHRLGAKVVLGAAVERVRLVHKEDSPAGRLGDFLGLDGRLANVLAHQVGSRGLDKLTARQQALALQDLAHQARHRGLARAGVA